MLGPIRVMLSLLAALGLGAALGLAAESGGPQASAVSVSDRALFGVSNTGAVDTNGQRGIGESLIIVTSGETFATEQGAIDAAEKVSIGELQGFYVDRTDNYVVMGRYEQVNPRYESVYTEGGQGIALAQTQLRYVAKEGALPIDRWMLASAFRTKRGAEEFIDLLNTAEDQYFSAYRVRKVAGTYIGLGQESHPNGNGPLLTPLADADVYQE